MKAIILAAGKGTRLRPFNETKPKCLVELAGKSLLQHQLDTLSKCGITDIHVIGGYNADQLINKKYTRSLAELFAYVKFRLDLLNFFVFFFKKSANRKTSIFQN